ncbi:MAG: RloB family protein [Lutibacter sp.]|jgi:hypothetical protein
MRRSKSIPIKSKTRCAFVVDGECEFWYIQMLKRNERSINVNLEPKIPQRKKLSEQYKLVLELSKDYNKVYWIIDFDVIDSETRSTKKGHKTAIKEFKEYFNIIEKKHENIHVIINNPCLEFWILLHFETTSKFYENCEKVIDQLKKRYYLPDYEKSQKYYTKQDNDIYLKLKPDLKNAITNSNKLGMFDFKNPHSGLSQMQLIFETGNLKKLIE